VIGGAYGVDETVSYRANCTISYGKAVFPHQLIRLMVVEQLYRAYSILAGSSYHHS
jgi:23S rRNA (pseudouridine1915-N3)-methyltransferase